MHFIDKINKNKWVVFATIFVVIFLGAVPTFNKNFTLISFIMVTALLAVCFCLFNYENSFLVLLSVTIFEVLNVPNQPISLTASISSIFAAVFFIKYLIDLKNKKKNFDLQLVIANFILLIYGLFNLQFAQLEAFFSHAVMIVIIYLSFVYAKEINLKKASLFFIGSIIASIIVSGMFAFIPALKDIVIYNNERFMAFCGNPNQLQIFCLIGLAINMVLFYSKKINVYNFCGLSLILVVAGILTMSKSFLICLLLLVILFIIMMFKQSIKTGAIVTGATLALVFVLVVLFNSKISAIIERFTQYNYTNFIDTLLTGRASIWGIFMAEWEKSFASIMFGCGVTAPQLVEIGTHSVYIDTIYKYGLIGIALIAYVIYVYITKTNNKKDRFKLYGAIPLLMFLILSFVETIFYTKYVFMFILLCYLVFNLKTNKTKNMPDEETKIIKKGEFFKNEEPSNENS